MHLDEFRQYCFSKKGVIEDFPFGEGTMVFKVGGKMFALTSFAKPLSVNLKCDPEQAVELRERYEEVQPGYHMSKKHWNTVNFEGRIPVKELKQMVDRSYDLVVKGLSSKLRTEFS